MGGSVIFTTNVEFSRWGTVFADDKLAAAIVERVAPRQARGVRRTQPQDRGASHAGKVGKVETAARS